MFTFIIMAVAYKSRSRRRLSKRKRTMSRRRSQSHRKPGGSRRSLNTSYNGRYRRKSQRGGLFGLGTLKESFKNLYTKVIGKKEEDTTYDPYNPYGTAREVSPDMGMPQPTGMSAPADIMAPQAEVPVQLPLQDQQRIAAQYASLAPQATYTTPQKGRGRGSRRTSRRRSQRRSASVLRRRYYYK